MNSMTGFGRAEVSRKEYHLSVELSSVNGRFLELIFRMPRNLAGLELPIKELITKKLVRGKVTITVNLDESPLLSSESLINFEMARLYHSQLKKLKRTLKLGGEIEVGHIVSHPQLLVTPNDRHDESKLWPDLKRIINAAVQEMLRMRRSEGRNLQKDIKSRLNLIGKLIGQIKKQAPKGVIEYRKKLMKRIKDLGEGLEIDPSRMAEEVTIYTDRSDLTEECVRLGSHVEMFNAAMKANGEIGKRLNFILQEMGREANTISSKSLNGKTSNYAIAMKEEIEKLREQVQNIE